MTTDILALIVSLEKSLHRRSLRRSRERLNELLHDDFQEISASGCVYHKNQTIQALLKENPRTINASDFEITYLSKVIVLLKYKATVTSPDNSKRTTLRSSIWKNNGTARNIILHLGTSAQTNK